MRDWLIEIINENQKLLITITIWIYDKMIVVSHQDKKKELDLLESSSSYNRNPNQKSRTARLKFYDLLITFFLHKLLYLFNGI